MPQSGYDANGNPIDENGNRYFAGLGNINQNAGNQSFDQQGFAGVSGFPAPSPGNPDPAGRPGFPGTPNMPRPFTPNDPGFNPGRVMDGNPLFGSQITGQGQLVNPTPKFTLSNPAGRGGAPTPGSGDPNPAGRGTGNFWSGNTPAAPQPQIGNPLSRQLGNGGFSVGMDAGTGTGMDYSNNNPASRGGNSNLANITYAQRARPIAAVSNTGEDGQTNTNGAVSPAWNQFLGGRNPMGSAGVNLNWQGTDPNNRPSQYFGQVDHGGDAAPSIMPLHPRLNADGSVIGKDGQAYYQVGGVPTDSHRYKSLDPANFTYDEEFGVLTPRSNLNLAEDPLDRAMPYVVGAALGAPALGAAMGGMGGFAAGAPEGLSGLGISGGGSLGAGAGLSGGGAVEAGALGAGAGLGASGGGAGGLGVEGSGSLGAGAGVEAGAGVGGGLSSFLSNPLARAGLGQLANSIFGGGGGGGSPTQRGSGGGGLGDLLTGGYNLYNDNKGIQNMKQMLWDFYNRGDIGAGDRQKYLDKLRQLELDPSGAIENDQGYKDMRQKELDNVSRTLNARGFNMSGNEMGELSKDSKIMDRKYISDEKNSARASANLGDPSGMARAGMGSLGMFAQMQANRNSAANGVLGQIINGKTVQDWLKGLKDGTVNKDDLPPEVQQGIDNGDFGDESAGLNMTNPAGRFGTGTGTGIGEGDDELWSWIIGG